MINSNRDEELEIIRQLLIATASRTESNSEKIDQLTEKLDRQTINLDRLEANVSQLTDDVSEMRVRMDRFEVRAEADRGVMMAMLEEMVELRQENRQILDYLFGQQRNGNGDQPTP